MNTKNRNIYILQVGKTEKQKELFRDLMMPGVKELPYPSDRGAEDWRVRETIARELLNNHEGLWFIDHDLFIKEEAEGWLDDMDNRFSQLNVCLCHPITKNDLSVTNPAFWLSPRRFPAGMPSFARLPLQEDPAASEPYNLTTSTALTMPQKDTLVAAKELLQKLNMVYKFPLSAEECYNGGPSPFPHFQHIGGLYTFVYQSPPDILRHWVIRCVNLFDAFYATCPPEWLSAEDPILMQQLAKFRDEISGNIT